MTNDPKISVIMAVYNGERHLRDAVDSILNQTFKDFEFIIINDGSIDSTQEILELYSDPRIVLIHQEHMGFTKSLNKGIHLANGKYIARQDADDISMPERLGKQLAFLESYDNVALLGTAAKIIDDKGVYLQTRKYPCDNLSIQEGIKHYNFFCHGSVMFKRKIFFDLGGYREFFSTAQDYDLWLRFAEKFEVANLSIPLYIHRFNFSSLTYKKIAFQRRMGTFARHLASAREKGINEEVIIRKLKHFLKSPISLNEKRVMIQRYNYWSLLLLKHNKKDDAFILMNKGVKHHPSEFYKKLFKITKAFRTAFFLEILIRLSYLFVRHFR